MYVCLCNGVTDRDIKKAVNKGCDSMAALQCQMSIANQCGKCTKHTNDIIKAEQTEASDLLIATFS